MSGTTEVVDVDQEIRNIADEVLRTLVVGIPMSGGGHRAASFDEVWDWVEDGLSSAQVSAICTSSERADAPGPVQRMVVMMMVESYLEAEKREELKAAQETAYTNYRKARMGPQVQMRFVGAV